MYLPRSFQIDTAEYPRVDVTSLSKALKCWAYTLAGVSFLGLGLIGIYLPGVPTTGPVLLSLFLLAKGCPRLHSRLKEHPRIGPYAGYLDGSKTFSFAARCYAITCMWTSIVISCFLLSFVGNFRLPAIVGCVAGGLVGTVVIIRFARKSRSEISGAETCESQESGASNKVYGVQHARHFSMPITRRLAEMTEPTNPSV